LIFDDVFKSFRDIPENMVSWTN